ncbi:hypothetical protein B0H10DRAFT_1913587 [Mycena sp. CBHHK59/15]|nr:hypothetical protein B0H10DRAFT_1913587 [Mycena sp. CBHHK59/15]
MFPRDGPVHEPQTRINGGTFIGGNLTHIQCQGELGFHILHRASASDAFHNSVERYPQPRCHPEMWTEMLEDLWNWSNNKDNPASSVLWLYGPAGAGKSAITQSFCQKLQEVGRLGASFSFKGGHTSHGNAKKLKPTIAYQLALLLSQLKDLSTRLQKLIIKPCQTTLDLSLMGWTSARDWMFSRKYCAQ